MWKPQVCSRLKSRNLDTCQRIFGTFNKLNPRAEGTGIGLSLVEKIIEAHGGRLGLESEPGIGSTFYFSLPRVSTEDP